VLVAVEIGVETVVGNEQIRPAIVIVIGGAYGKIFAFRLIDISFVGYVGESSITIIMV
jgi:hypothetical protein